MIIAEIKREKGHLARIAFDNGEEALLDIDFCNEKCLRAGDNITKEDLRRYTDESDYRRAKSRALWLLDRYTYTESRLFQKLKSAGFGAKPAAKAVARLKELGLIDDRSLALAAAEDYARRGVSKRAAYAKLLAKGFSKETAGEATGAAAFDEAGQLSLLIDRKYKNALAAGETGKVFAALVRRGFSFGAVREALKKYSEEIELSEDL